MGQDPIPAFFALAFDLCQWAWNATALQAEVP